MEYFQIRKNIRQVIRVFRGPFEGHDLTRIQIWYKERDGDEYKPGRVVAFNSEALPGVLEAFLLMAEKEPRVDCSHLAPTGDLTEALSTHSVRSFWKGGGLEGLSQSRGSVFIPEVVRSHSIARLQPAGGRCLQGNVQGWLVVRV